MLLISEMLDPKVQLICRASVIKWGLRWNFFVKRQIQEHVMNCMYSVYRGFWVFWFRIQASRLVVQQQIWWPSKIRPKYLHSACIDVLQQWQKSPSLHGWGRSSCLRWPLAVVKLMHVQIWNIDLCSAFHTVVSSPDIHPSFREMMP